MPKSYSQMTPEEKKRADRDTNEGGWGEANTGRELHREDTPAPPKPKAATPKPKSPDRPYKKVSPDRPYKKMAKGGSVRGKGCEVKGSGRGRFV